MTSLLCTIWPEATATAGEAEAVAGSDRGKLCGIGILDFEAECPTGHVVSGSAQVLAQMAR